MTHSEKQPRVLAVTGAASGIGLAICHCWRAENSPEDVIILLDRDADKLKETTELGKNVLSITVDVRDSGAVNEAVSTIGREFGRIDALVNCAGNSRPVPTSAVSDEDWEAVVDVHLNGTLRVVRATFPLLKQSGGSIVNLGSVASVLGMPKRASYNAAKHAIIGLTKSLAVEWAQYGVRVNAVSPGYVLTDLTQKLVDDGVLDTAPVTARTPLGRWAEPVEIADGVVFLLSDKARYITGHNLMIDGGMTVSGNWY